MGSEVLTFSHTYITYITGLVRYLLLEDCIPTSVQERQGRRLEVDRGTSLRAGRRVCIGEIIQR